MIPGDERKFKRRFMVAFIPTCNCGGRIAHASGLDEISTAGVGNGSGVGDSSVGTGEFVGLGVTVFVGNDVSGGVGVAVGGIGVWVDMATVGVGGSGVWVEVMAGAMGCGDSPG